MYAAKKCLVIFDGHCRFCNGWVRFLLKKDRNDRFRFFPAQLIPNNQLNPENRRLAGETVIVYFDGSFFYQSEAIFLILSFLPGAWGSLQYFRKLPRSCTDRIYRFIARIRGRLFGRDDQCPIVPEKFLAKYPDPNLFENYL